MLSLARARIRATALLSALTALALAPAALAHAPLVRISAHVDTQRTFILPRPATHVAIHWRGRPNALVRVALSRDGRHFGAAHLVSLDEIGMARHNGETYGTLIVARAARAVHVWTSVPLERISIVALSDHGRASRRSRARSLRGATYAQPTVTPRAGWGADESLRYTNGVESWPPAFYPVQKLILHHTDTQNNDPDPAATIRSIYYYHAVTQGWGDIGYNFLIDESGRVYEGRHSRTYPPGVSPTGADASGNGVTGAHAYGYNSGTVGIALLGTLTSQDATPAARQALEHLLAWEASQHNIDPGGSALYTNPVNGTQTTFANIAGHRDVVATECPGATFYATLPSLRTEVAALLAGSGSPPPPPPPAQAPVAMTGTASSVTASSATVSGSVSPNGQTTSYHFDYGGSSTYGSHSPTVTLASTTGQAQVTRSLSGLARSTRYHYRLVAVSSGGSSYGADRSFTTARR